MIDNPDSLSKFPAQNLAAISSALATAIGTTMRGPMITKMELDANYGRTWATEKESEYGLDTRPGSPGLKFRGLGQHYFRDLF